MFSATLLCQVLLATAAFAVPTSKERFAQRLARRAGGIVHQSQPKQAIEPAHVGLEVNAHSNASHASYSTNWAGAVLSKSTVRRRICFGDGCTADLLVLRSSLGYLQVRHWHLRRPPPEGALWRVRRALRVCLGRHRRRHLQQRHPPDRRRLQHRRQQRELQR